MRQNQGDADTLDSAERETVGSHTLVTRAMMMMPHRLSVQDVTNMAMLWHNAGY